MKRFNRLRQVCSPHFVLVLPQVRILFSDRVTKRSLSETEKLEGHDAFEFKDIQQIAHANIRMLLRSGEPGYSVADGENAWAGLKESLEDDG